MSHQEARALARASWWLLDSIGLARYAINYNIDNYKLTYAWIY